MEYPVEVRDHAELMIVDRLFEHDSTFAACKALAPTLDMVLNTLRRGVVQSQIGACQKEAA